MNIFWIRTKYFLAWLISLILFLYIVTTFLKIEITQDLVLAGMGYALFTTLIFYRRHIMLFGHLPGMIGFSVFILAIVLLLGAMSWDLIDKEKW